jgi:PAS domain S-box/diguanylate cyclase (GGDEF) domain
MAEPRIAAALQDWRSRGSPVEPAGYALRAGDHEVGLAGVPDADWMVLRSGHVDDLLAGVVEGEKRARWVASGVAVVGGALMLLITFWFLRPLARLKQRALQLIGEDADVELGWPDLGGELGELANVLQHVMRERQASQAAGQRLLAKMRAVMAKAPVGIAFTRNRKFELVSDEFNRLLGYEGSGLEGEAARVIYPSDEFYQGLGTRVGAAFGMGRVFSEEIEFVRRDGSLFWGQLLGAPVSPHDAGAGTIWTLGDISEERRKRNALSWAATHDALTNIANRQEFESQLADHLADRRRREVACMLYVDLDGFKAVNDAAGHAAGDQLLRDYCRAAAGADPLDRSRGATRRRRVRRTAACLRAADRARRRRADPLAHRLSRAALARAALSRRRQHRRRADRRFVRRRGERDRRCRRRLLRRQACRPQRGAQRRAGVAPGARRHAVRRAFARSH